MNRKSIAESEAFKKIGEPEEEKYLITLEPYQIIPVDRLQSYLPYFVHIADEEPAQSYVATVSQVTRLMLRQVTYFLLVMLAVGVGVAVFL